MHGLQICAYVRVIGSPIEFDFCGELETERPSVSENNRKISILQNRTKSHSAFMNYSI